MRRQGADIVFCAGDAEAMALAYGRERIPAIVAVPDYDVVVSAFDKLTLTQNALKGGLLAPRTLLPTDDNLASFDGRPMMVKSRLHWTPDRAMRTSRIEAERCSTAREAREAVTRFQRAGGEPVLQEIVGHGAPLAVHTVSDAHGDLLVAVAGGGPPRFWPPAAGRRTRVQIVELDSQLRAAIAATNTAMGWSGFGSFAFLLDADGKPYFVDFNGRIPMSLDATVLCARVNVMTIWTEVTLGHPLSPLPQPRIGGEHQWLGGDLKRAFVERRGGLVPDVAETLSCAVRSRHTMLQRRDLRPTLRLTGQLGSQLISARRPHR